jgi:hypothetical protein
MLLVKPHKMGSSVWVAQNTKPQIIKSHLSSTSSNKNTKPSSISSVSSHMAQIIRSSMVSSSFNCSRHWKGGGHGHGEGRWQLWHFYWGAPVAHWLYV